MKLRGLYAVTDSQLLAGKFLSYVEAALDGGVTLLQYRDKSGDETRRLREATELLKLCERYKTRLIINDDAEVAPTMALWPSRARASASEPSVCPRCTPTPRRAATSASSLMIRRVL